MMQSHAFSRLRLLTLLGMAVATAWAVDHDVRLVPQLAAGTAGLEPGLALELRDSSLQSLVVRPELLISEDGRLGGGGAILYELGAGHALPARQAIAIGPRLVYHNADDSGWEADALATWSYELDGSIRAWRQAVGVLGAVGLRHDKAHEDHDIGATVGIFYAIRL